ncbi:hypothetical protein [Kiritimatiella glycovorans]|uniref:Uncharacterized protein n=1 Tax=Kiritimatiella glycovorans TaxID=1307763 RepID=A0A0G3EAY0_9BACT|nr:hypothetical protein [Kiritimatiella glycovorans]AKJ63646.1 hypothetical protein L21SP4_00365 [Kiritimatiella glycovorans]
MVRKLTGLLMLAALALGAGGAAGAASTTPDDDTRYLVFMRQPEELIFQEYPHTIHPGVFRDIREEFENLPASDVRIGMAFVFSYLKTDLPTLKASLKRFLHFARETDTPVLVKFDGEQWWQERPDLWNWWDPDLPGYDPANRANVEWSSWDPDDALKIAWRNWGRQIRVLPPPNLFSREYRAACHEAMDELLPIVRQWWRALPAEQKDLFIGVNIGWESSIGINAYHYPDGNERVHQPAEHDPDHGIELSEVPDRGVAQIGYASVRSAGIRDRGDITEDDLYEVIRRHLRDLSHRVHRAGFPREKIFTHGVGNRRGEKLYEAALNEYACPGWSNYWNADDPAQNEGIMRSLKKSDAPYWGSVEWNLIGSRDGERWKRALEKSLFYPGCRFLCVYNWEHIDDSEAVMDAVRAVIRDHARDRNE